MNDGFTKKDWALFRSKLPDWQEAYMERLCREYVKLIRLLDGYSRMLYSIISYFSLVPSAISMGRRARATHFSSGL